MKSLSVALAALVFSTFAASAEAAEEGELLISLGPGIQVAPPYEGATNMTIVPFPSGSIGRVGTAWQFTAPDDSPSIGLITGRFRTGIAVAFRGERNSKGSREGLIRIAPAFEPGVFVDLWPMDWLRTRVELRHGANGHSGWVTDVSADLVKAFGRITFAAGPRFGLGDSSYMRKYFSVTDAEAAANPLITSAYSASAGPRFVGAALSAIHRDGGPWTFSLGVAYHRLIGDATETPLVKQIGTAQQWITITMVNYEF